MADVTLAGLVKEGVSGVVGVARDLLLPGAVLALDAVAAQMAPLDAGFAALDPGHLGDLGQSSGLGSCSAAHPGGHSAAGGGDGSWFCHSAHAARQADNALLSHHRQVGDHGEATLGDVHRHAGVLDEQVLHRAGLRCGSLCSETGGRGDKPALIHAASLWACPTATPAAPALTSRAGGHRRGGGGRGQSGPSRQGHGCGGTRV